MEIKEEKLISKESIEQTEQKVKVPDIKDELIAKAKEAGVKVTKAQAEKFQKYLEMLLEWNEKINLTAITDPSECVVKHFVDSLLFLKTVSPKQNAKIIDVGTGAGFPGIPIAIMRPDVKLTLLDSLNKRLIFLCGSARSSISKQSSCTREPKRREKSRA